MPESIHRPPSFTEKLDKPSQRLGRLLLSAPRISQVSRSGTSPSFLPRARDHISHPPFKSSRKPFLPPHPGITLPLPLPSHQPFNLRTTDTNSLHLSSPTPLSSPTNNLSLVPPSALSQCRAPTPTSPPAAKLPRDGPRPSHQPLRPPAETAPPLRLSTVTSMVTMVMATANFPRYHSLTPPHSSRIPKGPLNQTR